MSFDPVFRMIVCSDIHFGASAEKPENFAYPLEERDWFERAIAHAYAYADRCAYTGMDLFAAVGDFVNTGAEEEMLAFRDSLDRALRPETARILTMASHEYFFDGVEPATGRLERVYGQKAAVHRVIKGFHLIGLSTDDRCNTGREKRAWLKEELAAAHADTPEKPIFFFFHPQFANTVYGSAILWRTPAIMQTAMNYPGIVAFGGHSHASINDPRTVHQKHFTCFGTGGIISVSICNADRLPFQDPREGLGRSSLLIVEADAAGRVNVLPMNAETGKFYRSGWLIEKPWDPDTFIYTDDRYDTAQKPVFPAGARLSAAWKDGLLTVGVTQARDGDERVPGYLFTVRNGAGIVLRRFGISSHYFLDDLPETEEYTVKFAAPPGTYTLECRAESFFDKLSDPLTASFQI